MKCVRATLQLVLWCDNVLKMVVKYIGRITSPNTVVVFGEVWLTCFVRDEQW